MSRNCNECKREIPFGSDHIEVKFIGIKEMEQLYKTNHLNFCSFLCLVKFWSRSNEEWHRKEQEKKET